MAKTGKGGSEKLEYSLYVRSKQKQKCRTKGSLLKRIIGGPVWGKNAARGRHFCPRHPSPFLCSIHFCICSVFVIQLKTFSLPPLPAWNKIPANSGLPCWGVRTQFMLFFPVLWHILRQQVYFYWRIGDHIRWRLFSSAVNSPISERNFRKQLPMAALFIEKKRHTANSSPSNKANPNLPLR